MKYVFSVIFLLIFNNIGLSKTILDKSIDSAINGQLICYDNYHNKDLVEILSYLKYPFNYCESSDTPILKSQYKIMQNQFKLMLIKSKKHPGKYEYRIGYSYMFGLGTTINLNKAADWFDKSSQLGNQRATINFNLLKVSLFDPIKKNKYCNSVKSCQKSVMKALLPIKSSDSYSAIASLSTNQNSICKYSALSVLKGGNDMYPAYISCKLFSHHKVTSIELEKLKSLINNPNTSIDTKIKAAKLIDDTKFLKLIRYRIEYNSIYN